MIQTFPLRTSYPLAIREKLSHLMKMAFPVIYQPGQGVYDLNQTLDFTMSRALGIDWWLSGGISAATGLATYTPKGAASLAASYDNNAAPGNGLPDGTHDAFLGTAPAFDTAIGWILNGVTNSRFLKTDLVPTSTMGAIICFNNAAASIEQYMFGVFQGAGRAFAIMPYYTDNKIYYGKGAWVSKSPGIQSGTLAIGTTNFYRNGLPDATVGAWSAITWAIWIGCFDNNVTGYGFFSGNIVGLAFYDPAPTDAQFLAIHNAAMLL